MCVLVLFCARALPKSHNPAAEVDYNAVFVVAIFNKIIIQVTY